MPGGCASFDHNEGREWRRQVLRIFPDAVGGSVEKVIDSIAPGPWPVGLACKPAQRKLPVDVAGWRILDRAFRRISRRGVAAGRESGVQDFSSPDRSLKRSLRISGILLESLGEDPAGLAPN